ncbi:CrcB family protein [Isoptericola halotolerans]|uniref:fluoride efflux transporter FluC n=1 Tax=Isoptericola halotolerans TaxID=300560 RepID=UPI00388DE1AC
MTSRPLPGHFRWTSIGLVMVGGTFGAAGREGVSLAVPDLDQMPVATLIANVVGAFLLGYLTVALAHQLRGDARGPRLTLLLGTGFCGGFTTYSSLATDTAILLDGSRVDLATIYVLATVLVGASATFAGIVVAARTNPQVPAADERTAR